MKVLARTRLQIKKQGAFLTQIASVYQSFLRAAMEYIDNSVDAAASRKKLEPTFVGDVRIEIDTRTKSVTFRDNCGGMEPSKLIGLLSDIGDSGKRGQAWTNGQFGFGVHAFRGFARYARFRSKTAKGVTAEILIDRDASEHDDVPCNDVTLDSPLTQSGTEVTISGFDAGIFKKSALFEGLIAEVGQHFDDVLRSEVIRVKIVVDGGVSQSVEAFQYSLLPGNAINEKIDLGEGRVIRADLKLLDKIAEDLPPVLTIKGRRIQQISELRSFRNYARSAGRNTMVWTNKFLVGGIEVAGVLDPTLTRDDVKNDNRDVAYAALLELQLRIEELVAERLEQKRQEAYDDLARKVSDCLASVLRQYKLRFDMDSSSAGGEARGQTAGSDEPFGGNAPGGGGPGGDGVAKGGTRKGKSGNTGPGEAGSGGGSEGPDRASTAGKGAPEKATSNAPQIKFSDFQDEPLRVLPFGTTLTVNTAHPDFVRRRGAVGTRVGSRLIAYVAQVVAGPCVEFLYAKRGKPLIAANVANQVTDISIRLEEMLVDTGALDQMITGAAL